MPFEIPAHYVYAAAAVFVLYLFRTPLTNFIESISKINIKHGKSRVDIETKTLSEEFKSARAERIRAEPKSAEEFFIPDSAIEEIISGTKDKAKRALKNKKILFSDDDQPSIRNEKEVAEKLGAIVDYAKTTNSTIEKMKTEKYDLIITDIKKGDDNQAGYKIIRAARELGIFTPIVLYALTTTKAQRREALDIGFFDRVSDPASLYRSMILALKDD